MINIVWFLFIIFGISYAIFTNNIDLVNDEIIKSSKEALDIFFNIFPNIVLWLGIMTIAKDSGLLNKISNFLHPILSKIFPDIPKNHESLGYISSNITANILGLGNASTPFGIKAMKSLQELNKDKNTISKSMITFILLNVCGFTLLPTTIISLRNMNNSVNSTSVLPMIVCVTFITTIISLILNRRLNE